MELWNLVFMQFNKTRRGILEPLQKKHVDTGMGLERLVAVLQGKTSNYDTDLFAPLLQRIHELTNAPPYRSKFGQDDHEGLNTAYRILADHARMLTVAIADGMLPQERGAPFVLRKILRRAALLFETKFHADPLLLAQLVPAVREILGEAYPEVFAHEAKVQASIVEDVEKYKRTLETGRKAFRDICRKLENKMALPAERVFDLYANMGVPEELILSMAKERNMRCDLKGFYELLEGERAKSRAGLAATKAAAESAA
ncbi:Alanine--tRNA ligase, cytoplasmic [Hypsibius exemplaris]|uniref:alanine--tRNA ligase n=1 Tax=Hypsibius exemplaris TaxID=2072580 RepID=A0A9X6NLI3_HYPEX|nr:Alanine--tRNA ligase, cytoplasmic [Hypsibius exemplaris]